MACKTSNSEQSISADNNVVAHRGAWKAKNLPENSIASLKHAITLHCTGSEFDVHMTLDSVLVVTHDAHHAEMEIANTAYKDLAIIKLSNGEILPKLSDMIKAGMEDNLGTGLVCEIKPTTSIERGHAVATKVLELVKSMEAEKTVTSYISFDYHILKKIIELQPKAKTEYLNGDKTPAQLKKDGITGLDYNLKIFKQNPEWIQQAKDLSLSLNVWTVNTKDDLRWFLDQDFDYITTNEPERLFELLNAK